MSVRYLFNTSGTYVAFIYGTNLFSNQGNWIGSVEQGNEVWDVKGQFIGYVFDDDRIIKKTNEMPKMPHMPKMPPMPPMPPLPPLPRLPKLPLPPPYKDVFENA